MTNKMKFVDIMETGRRVKNLLKKRRRTKRRKKKKFTVKMTSKTNKTNKMKKNEIMETGRR